MKKQIVLAFAVLFAGNLSAQKVEETKTYQKNGDIVAVTASQYDVMFGAGNSATDPLSVVILKDKYGAKLGQMSFFPAGHKNIAVASTKTDRTGFELNYSIEVFEAITDMLEDKAAVLEFNTKSQRASVNFVDSKAGNASAGGGSGVNTKPGTTGGATRSLSPTKGEIKSLENSKLQPAGKLKKVP